MTFDGGMFKVYLDGKDAFELKAGGPRVFGGTFYVGSRYNLGTSEYYEGLLDELGVYTGVLTQAKVAEIMTGGVLGQLLAISPHSRLASTWGLLKASHQR